MSGDDEPAPGLEPGLDAAYAVETPEDNRRLYRTWAETYESDFMASTNYIYHEHVARIFIDGFGDLGAPILDVGCGTGVVGEELRSLGVGVVDGIDISPEMLAVARSKSADGVAVYRDLIEADLTGKISIADGTYAGVISAGAFTHGHLGPGSLDELIRAACPGARFTLGINAAHFEQDGFAARFDRHSGDGQIIDYHTEDAIIYGGADGDDLDQISRVAVFSLPG